MTFSDYTDEGLRNLLDEKERSKVSAGIMVGTIVGGGIAETTEGISSVGILLLGVIVYLVWRHAHKETLEGIRLELM